MKKKIIIIAAVIILVIGIQFAISGISGYLSNRAVLADAKILYEEGKYDSTIELLWMNDITGNALEEKANEAKIKRIYDAAIDKMNKKEYKEALVLFELFEDGEYKDVKAKKTECEEKYKEAIYLETVSKYNENPESDFVLMLKNFRNLKGYKDSDEYIAKILGKHPSYAMAGEYLYLGSYEQDNNTENGKEPVKWFVPYNSEELKTRLYTVNVIDVQPFDTVKSGASFNETSLFKWLNSDFYDSAFTDEEKAVIETAKANSFGVKFEYKVTIPFGAYASERAVATEYSKAKGLRIENEKPCFWVSDYEKEAGICVNGENEKADATLKDIGVVAIIYADKNPGTLKKCEDCKSVYFKNEKCEECFYDKEEIKKEYFKNIMGNATAVCDAEECSNYVVYFGKSDCCAKHSGHCSECDTYIPGGNQKCGDCASFSNSYGTRNTKCAVKGCSSNIAQSGDTNCCAYHSNRCGKCKKYIDSDAMFCMECLEKAFKK